MKKKFVFIGDTNSINIEIIIKSHNFLKNKVKYILLGNISDLENELSKLFCKKKVNRIFDPFNQINYKKDQINIYNIENLAKKKYKNLLNQINVANFLSLKTGIDLVTLPIDKSLFKKHIEFTGMTEYLGKINNKKTIMLMHGNQFSIIPLTTHINLKKVSSYIKEKIISSSLKEIKNQINKKSYKLNFKKVNFLCYNPHCGEKNTLGFEDDIISKCIKKLKNISGPFPADSAFNKIDKNTLFISMYHDQALIPFKIINQKSMNITLGLNYIRLSPAHGTASDIKYKGLANNSSYLECMQY